MVGKGKKVEEDTGKELGRERTRKKKLKKPRKKETKNIKRIESQGEAQKKEDAKFPKRATFWQRE